MKEDSKAFVIARRLWHTIPRPWRTRFWAWRDQVVPYQRITYRGRLLSWGRDRSAAYRLAFPDPPTGKTILDVGCYTGFYCFSAVEEGASYCLGLEKRRQFAAKGQALVQKAGTRNLEIIQGDALDYDFDRRFDIVLCLNVLHHLRSVERAGRLVNKLYDLANEKLVFMVLLPRDSSAPYEYVQKGGVAYVHLSPTFFEERFGTSRVWARPMDARLYGPGRLVVHVTKPNAQGN